jgi:hypothetical protein
MIRARHLHVIGTVVVAASIALFSSAQDSGPARPNLDNTERLLGILPQVTQLQKLSVNPSPEDRWQILWLHQQISERVLYAYLEFDAANARIDREMAHANELHSYLSDRRDNVVTRANLLGIVIGGGLSGTSNGLQLSSSLGKPAAIVGLVGGIASAGFGLMGIHAQNGKTTDFDFDSNMLAEFFDRPTLPDSTYNPLVWTLLNQPPGTGPAGETGKEQLLRLWVRVKRVDSLDSKEKIDHLTSQPSEMLKLSIDDLEDRAAMLHDVRARISYLKLDLAAILASLPAPPPSEAISPVTVPKAEP